MHSIGKLVLVTLSIATSIVVVFGDGPVDWYDCGEREAGNYYHPKNCTLFMSCTAAGQAFERLCGACHLDTKRCPGGLLVFNQTQNKCLWWDETECINCEDNNNNELCKPGGSSAESFTLLSCTKLALASLAFIVLLQ